MSEPSARNVRAELDRSPVLIALRMALEEIAAARAERRATLRVVVDEQRRRDGHAA